MELELVRIGSTKHPGWTVTYLLKPGVSDRDVVLMYGNSLLDDWFDDEVKRQVTEEGSFKVIGRIDICAEDAYTLGLKIGDIL